MTARTRWLILAFALAGLAAAVASSWVHYRLLTDPGYISPCDIGGGFNCTQAYLSEYGSIWGVPVALGGVIWFSLVALIAWFARPGSQSSPAGAYVFAMATIGLGVSLYLAYASFFVLKTGCLLCIATYVCVLAIFLLSGRSSPVSLSRLPMRFISDLRALVAHPTTFLAALLYLAGAVSVVAFFPKEGEQAPAPAPSAEIQQDFAARWAAQPRVDLGIPADGAKVIVVKFNDYACPACAQAHAFYKPIFEKFAASHPGAVKSIVKDWPWNSACNFNTSSTIPGHEGACDAAAAARMARDRGKLDEMETWLYAHQRATGAEIRRVAAEMLGVTDFDREYALKLPEIRRDIADGGVLRVDSTPTYFINGVRVPGGMPVQLFELAIQLELEK